MRTTFVNELINSAKHNHNIELLTGDLGFGVLKDFEKMFPDRFTNCGIAEQNMLSMAGGMASQGKCVVVYSIGNFPTIRALEQIRNDICYYNHNVKIVCIGGGYTYGSLGMSHHATEDIAVMRAMPNMTIFVPSDKVEATLCVKKMFEIDGPCYLRLERDSINTFHLADKIQNLNEPQIVVNENSKYAIFTYGTIIDEVFDLSKKMGIDLFTVPCLKPISSESFKQIIRKYKIIFTVEEHSIVGGLGDLICSLVSEDDYSSAKVLKIGINDIFLSSVGDQKYMRHCAKIDRDNILNIISNSIGLSR